jgi:hypothetical protein
MPLPDFGALMMEFERLDNQKEMLLIQRKQQTASAIAQAVTTLVSTPMEGRAGYLEMMKQELGLDTGFLQSLAMSAPTPTAILLNQGLQRSMEAGAVDPTDITAYALGADPMKFRLNQQVGKFLEDGSVPAYIQALPPEAQGAALQQLVTNAAGLPNLFELTNRDKIGAVKNDLAPGATAVLSDQGQDRRQGNMINYQQREGAAGRGVQYAQLAQANSQFKERLGFERDELLTRNSTSMYLGNLQAGASMANAQARGTGRGGKGLTADEAAGLSDMEFVTLYREAQKEDTETQKLAPGFFSDNKVGVQQAQNRTSAIMTVFEREWKRREERLLRNGFTPEAMGIAPPPATPPAPVVPDSFPNLFAQPSASSFGQLVTKPRP